MRCATCAEASFAGRAVAQDPKIVGLRRPGYLRGEFTDEKIAVPRSPGEPGHFGIGPEPDKKFEVPFFRIPQDKAPRPGDMAHRWPRDFASCFSRFSDTRNSTILLMSSSGSGAP